MESQSNDKVTGGGGTKGVSICDLILRVSALFLTLAAAIVIGLDKQTKFVPIQITPTLPPVSVEAHAKWFYLSAFVYFLVSNVIASSYAAISSLIVLATRRLTQITIVFDLFIVALLFSANGAALAIGLMGYQGNSHVQWNKVCNVFDRFCERAAISFVLSLVGSIAFLALVAVAALTLHKRISK
ncbi:hypothetical protein PTKIN_Ptkin10aG0022100 [Pterospermum kingtungense]